MTFECTDRVLPLVPVSAAIACRDGFAHLDIRHSVFDKFPSDQFPLKGQLICIIQMPERTSAAGIGGGTERICRTERRALCNLLQPSDQQIFSDLDDFCRHDIAGNGSVDKQNHAVVQPSEADAGIVHSQNPDGK